MIICLTCIKYDLNLTKKINFTEVEEIDEL